MAGPTYSAEDVKRLSIYAKKCSKVSSQGCEKIVKTPDIEELLIHVSKEAPMRAAKLIDKMQAACKEGLEMAKNAAESKKRARDGEIGNGEGGNKRPRSDTNAEDGTLTDDAYERYETETAITDGEPPVFIKEHCLDVISKSHLADRGDFDVDAEFLALLEDLQKFEYEIVKERILQYLNDCRAIREKTGGIPAITDSSAQWSTRSPMLIHEILLKKHKDAETAKINRGYGQPIFYNSVNKQAEDKGDQLHLSTEQVRNKRLILLEQLASEKAGPVSTRKKEMVYNSFRTEYHAGKTWLEIADWFNGNAIVIVLVLAGIGSSKITEGWSKYQRECLHYISRYLYGIKKLVSALGAEGLEFFCRYGYLEDSVIENLKATEIFVTVDQDDTDGEL